jgi:hypothetical protein
MRRQAHMCRLFDRYSLINCTGKRILRIGGLWDWKRYEMYVYDYCPNHIIPIHSTDFVCIYNDTTSSVYNWYITKWVRCWCSSRNVCPHILNERHFIFCVIPIGHALWLCRVVVVVLANEWQLVVVGNGRTLICARRNGGTIWCTRACVLRGWGGVGSKR